MIILCPCAFVCTHAIMCALMFFVCSYCAEWFCPSNVSYMLYTCAFICACMLCNQLLSYSMCMCYVFMCINLPETAVTVWSIGCVTLLVSACVVFSCIIFFVSSSMPSTCMGLQMKWLNLALDSGDHVKHKNYAYAWLF